MELTMNKSVLEIILNHVPEAKIIESGDNGAYKIRLPYSVTEIAGYRELRRALKESPAKPICSTCRSENTRFRYFDNSSSKALQARYKCLACNHLFTLGGKRYCKDQHAASSSHDLQRKKKFNIEDHFEHDLISRKKIKWQEADCTFSRPDANDQYSMQNVETLKPDNFIDFFKEDAQNYVQRQLYTQNQYWGKFKHCLTDNDENLISSGLSKVVSLSYLKQKEGDEQDEQHPIELHL